MALEKSEAIILKSFNWSESSRTVLFFSRDNGKIPLIDKGGRSVKSKRGRLLPFCRLNLQYYASQKEGSGYIAGCDLLESFSLEGEGTLGRLAYGSAACELLYLLLPEHEEQTELFDVFVSFLRQISNSEKSGLPTLFLAFFLRLLSLLGYHPSLAYCADCGRNIEEIMQAAKEPGSTVFSPQRGGVVCSSCQTVGQQYIPISDQGLKRLIKLQTVPLSVASREKIGYDEAAWLTDAIARFMRYHVGQSTELKSLAFLDKLKKAQFKQA